MSIPTANVFISFSRDVMTQFLQGQDIASRKVNEDTGNPSMTFAESFTPAIQPDVFSFSNSNSNVDAGGALQILDFNHELGFKSGNLMTLSFLDPRREFEDRVFKGTLVSELAAYNIDYNPDQDFPDPHQQQKIVYIDKIPAKIMDIIGPEIENIKKERLDSGKRIYVTYGVGSNPASWSGPHRMYIMNAIIDAKASRIITLKLAATPKTVDEQHNLTSFGEPVKLPSRGKLSITGFSKRFLNVASFKPSRQNNTYIQSATGYKDIRPGQDLTNNPEVVYGFDESNENIIESVTAERPKIDKEQVNAFLKKVDMHSVIVDCIKNFVQKTTGNPNVIALFPNLNFILAPLIYSKMLEHKLDQPAGRSAYMKKVNQLERTMAVVDDVLTSLGLQLQKYAREVVEAIPGPGDLTRFTAYEGFDSSRDYLDFYATISTSEFEGNQTSVIDPKVKLSKVFYEINKYGRQFFSTDYNVISESDDKIISMWRELGDDEFSVGRTTRSGNLSRHVSKNPTFESLSWDEAGSESVVLVGAMHMCIGYLYGSKNILDEDVFENKEIIQSNVLDDLIRGFANNPLHPGDTLLASQGINEQIRRVILEKHTEAISSEMFGGSLISPDFFAFSDTEEGKKAQESIETQGVPIFKYNTSNPNILKVKANYNPAFWAALNSLSPLQHSTTKAALGVVGGRASRDLNKLSPGQLIARARAYLSTEGLGPDSLRSAISEGLKSSNLNEGLASAFVKDDLVADILKIAEANRVVNANNPLDITIKVDDLPTSEDASVALGSFINSAYRMVNQVTITTLPFPSFSNSSYLFKECVLLAQFPNIRQTEELPYSALDSFLSGVYRISGFKHTISAKTVDSQFKLVKNL